MIEWVNLSVDWVHADPSSIEKSRMTLKPTPEMGEQILRLHAEDIVVSRQVVTGDTLRASVSTHERDHHVDESLLRVNVQVERIPIGKLVDSVPPTREEGDTTILSVVEEVVVVERRLLLKEEVRIRRIETTERHQETIVVREQAVEISRVTAGSPDQEN